MKACIDGMRFEINTINFTKNGKCSNCGECCSAILPVSKTEIKRIKNYVKKYKIKPHKNNAEFNTIDLTCPFRNWEENKCDIYEVRPWICQRFICNNVKPNTAYFTKKIHPVNMREIFKG